MNKILVVIVAALVLFIAVGKGGGCNNGAKKSDTVVTHDTAWTVHDSLIYIKPKPAKIIHDTIPPIFLADTNYARLKVQYDSLLKEFFALKIYADTVRLDTLGYVSVIDSVQKNGLIGRSYHTNYKIPTVTVTKTITHYEKPKAQLYYGFGLDLNPTFAPTGAHGGIILKTKKDQLLGLNVGTSIDGGINYGFSSYWKIKLK
jgi:hypothetical protein